MNDSPAFVEYGLGIHDNIPGSSFAFDFQPDPAHDAIAVDPGLTLSPYTTTTPESHFTTPSSVPLLSPGSSIEYFGDHRGSIGSIDTTIAPHDMVTNTKDTTRNRPSKTTPGSSASTAATTTTSTMMTRTRKASAAQNANADAAASISDAQPRAKKQKTASSAQTSSSTTTVKQESQQQQQQQQQHQQQAPPPKRKSARRGGAAAAKKEDAAQRSKNLERNRIAASKCRQKKKEWVLELEETKSGMELRHTNLRMEYFQLLDEVTRIKNHLMAHASCNDPNINFWIEKEALKYVERCMDPAQERRPSMAAGAAGAGASAADFGHADLAQSCLLSEGITASGSCTLPSPAESHRSHLGSPIHKHEGINLDYMPDELLTGEIV